MRGRGVDTAGELLGGVTYVSGPNDPYSEGLREGEAGMRMLAVDRAHRRRGVGRTLTEWCLARARADGRLRLILHTAVWMPDAIRLYERMGFARQPQIDFAPAPGIDLIAYSFDSRPGRPSGVGIPVAPAAPAVPVGPAPVLSFGTNPRNTATAATASAPSGDGAVHYQRGRRSP